MNNTVAEWILRNNEYVGAYEICKLINMNKGYLRYYTVSNLASVANCHNSFQEKFQSDVHIGFGLLIVFPLLTFDGHVQYIVFVRSFVDKPASPIVQVNHLQRLENADGFLSWYYMLIWWNLLIRTSYSTAH